MNTGTAEVNDGQDVLATEMKKDADASRGKFTDVYEFISSIKGAPSKAQISQWKSSTPNQRLRLFTPDMGKRTYIVRAIGGMEMQKLEGMVPQNMAPEKAELERQLMVVSTCVVWTNTSSDTKLTVEALRAGSAGLPTTLFQLIAFVSDFMEPEMLDAYSAEL